MQELNGDLQPLRKTVDQACKRIAEQFNDQAVVVVFSFLQECHGTETKD